MNNPGKPAFTNPACKAGSCHMNCMEDEQQPSQANRYYAGHDRYDVSLIHLNVLTSREATNAVRI